MQVFLRATYTHGMLLDVRCLVLSLFVLKQNSYSTLSLVLTSPLERELTLDAFIR